VQPCCPSCLGATVNTVGAQAAKISIQTMFVSLSIGPVEPMGSPLHLYGPSWHLVLGKIYQMGLSCGPSCLGATVNTVGAQAANMSTQTMFVSLSMDPVEPMGSPLHLYGPSWHLFLGKISQMGLSCGPSCPSCLGATVNTVGAQAAKVSIQTMFVSLSIGPVEPMGSPLHLYGPSSHLLLGLNLN
jgi:hypothetical protein